MKKVLYHANCADGFCSACIAHEVFGDGAEYVAVQYGQEPPDVTNCEVYVLDFSYKRETLIAMAAVAKSIVVLDHHKTAQKELEDLSLSNCIIVFDMTKSGARLTWEYFYRGRVADIVLYVEDRDLWRWSLVNSREVSAAIASYPHDFNVWYGFDVRQLAVEGAAVIRYINQQVDRAVANAVEIELRGYKVLSMNATMLISEIGERLSKDRPFSATYFIREDGRRVWSLRSAEDGVDVSEVAKSYGGGGHAQAAGYVE